MSEQAGSYRITVCERLFERKIHREYDAYAWIPRDKETERIPNHRLSLRLTPDSSFEVYRHYTQRRTALLNGFILLASEDMETNEAAFRGSLEDAVRFCNQEISKYHEPSGLWKICEHREGDDCVRILEGIRT